MRWTSEIVTALRALAGAKMSAKDAAEHLKERFGVTLTRSAVLGKALRLGLAFEGDKSPEFAAKNAERMRKLNADPEFAAKHARKWAKKAVARAGLKPWKKLIDRAKALLADGHDIETAADALAQEFKAAHRARAAASGASP